MEGNVEIFLVCEKCGILEGGLERGRDINPLIGNVEMLVFVMRSPEGGCRGLSSGVGWCAALVR